MQDSRAPKSSSATDDDAFTTSPVSRRIQAAWLVAVGVLGFMFGLVADRRPFGDDMLAHPLIVLSGLGAMSLLMLRVMLARPVPDVIPERMLMVGCVIGIGTFLIGNFLGVHMLMMR